MNYFELLREQFNNRIDIREKRPGIFQLLAPLFHEDGDMLDIYLEPVNRSKDRVRICDYGMTLMRLSYGFELDTENKHKIFDKILSKNGIREENGNLYVETTAESLYPSILQFAQTVRKVSNMQLYRRELLQSLFFEMLTEFIEANLMKYNPRPKVFPMPERDDLEVSFAFELKPRPVYLFGVKDNTQARLATISCLEFQRAAILFKSAVVHEDFDSLTKKDRSRITSASDKQFVSLDDFKTNAEQFFQREAA